MGNAQALHRHAAGGDAVPEPRRAVQDLLDVARERTARMIQPEQAAAAK